MSEKTEITFIGSADVLPEVGQETASFVLNRRYLVDCGWCVALEMRRYGLNPNDMDALFLTHVHHDHVMGLPALLYHRGMRQPSGKTHPPLRIYGPAEDVAEVVENTRRFLNADRFPDVWPNPEVSPLSPGDEVREGTLRIRVERNRHGVPGLAYRFEDAATGSVIVYTGDTGYAPELADIARNADLLIHEAFFPPDRPAQPKDTHCSPTDAARLAKEAGVKQLALIHYRRPTGPEWLAAAREIFPNTVLAEEGLKLQLG